MSVLETALKEPPVRLGLVSQLQDLLAAPGYQVISLQGAAGVGKSHLIRQLLQGRPYIAGKFDTGKDTTLAYAAFIQAIRRILNQLLSLPDQDFARWQTALRCEVPLASLLHVLPELGYFQADDTRPSQSAMLTDTLTLTRPFERAFLKLWQCLTQGGQAPSLSLVWLDDVQWMDEASLAFFEFLLEQDLPVHWILTGRDTRAVEALLQRLEVANQPQLRLEPFSEAEAEAYILARLGWPREDSRELAAFLYRISQGYPLELAWGIKELVQERKIVYDQGWQYAGQLADLVSSPHKGWEQLMSQQWQRLPPRAQALLQTAALLGPKFSRQLLQQVLPEQAEVEFAANWALVLDAGFLDQGQGDDCHFAHDRLYEWVQQGLAPAAKAGRQLEIARRLLASEQAPLELLVELLNACQACLQPQEQRLRLDKNLTLIRAMLSQGAIAQAQQLLDRIHPDIKAEDPLFRTSQMLRASLAYLLNDMDAAEALLQTLLAQNSQDMLDAQLLLIVIYTQHNRYHEAVHFAIDLLAAQGLVIDQTPAVAAERFARCLAQTRARSIEDLLACAEGAAPALHEGWMKVIATAAAAIYNYDLQLYSHCILYALDQLLAGQGSSRAAAIYSAASLQLLCISGDLAAGFKLIQASEQVARRSGRDDELTMIHCIMGDMIAPWQMSFARARDYLLSSREAGTRSGNLQFAGYACVFRGSNLLLCAHPLAELAESILPDLIRFNQRIQNYSPLDGLKGYAFLIAKLRSGEFATPEQSEQAFIADLRQRESNADLSRYFSFKALVLLLFGDEAGAFEALGQSQLHIYLPSSISRVWHLLVTDLLHWRLGLPSPDQTGLLPFDLETLARINPDNFEVLYRIWLAERPEQAEHQRLQAYHQALRAARDQAQSHWEGYALERIARIQQAQGLDQLAQHCLLESIQAYQRWGASAKVQQLLAELTPHYRQQHSLSSQHFSQDVAEILRICAEFSKILSPTALQQHMLQVLKTQTRAARIELLFKPEDSPHWRCVTLDEASPGHLQESLSQVPHLLLNYVARTHQSVVLPAQREIFSGHELYYLDGQHLLLPLVFQQTLMGMIYLQPQAGSDAGTTFFGFQVEMLLQALGGYLAGALYNAQRSQNLENLIARHTADLQSTNLRLSQLLQERQEVLAIAAHDIKHPLGTLRLGLSMLEQLEDSLPPEMRQKAFENLSQTLEDMNHNTERLLMIEHLEMDILKPHWKELPLSEVLRPFCESYEWKAREKQQALIFIGCEQDATIESDPGMLRMTLNNLLENAIKFSPLGGRIEVELRLTPRDFSLRILDQGPGFSAADQAQLFQKFGRLSARPTAGESSHGLGLFIVRRLVADLGGEIQVASEPGAGTCFTVSFARRQGLMD